MMRMLLGVEMKEELKCFDYGVVGVGVIVDLGPRFGPFWSKLGSVVSVIVIDQRQ